MMEHMATIKLLSTNLRERRDAKSMPPPAHLPSPQNPLLASLLFFWVSFPRNSLLPSSLENFLVACLMRIAYQKCFIRSPPPPFLLLSTTLNLSSSFSENLTEGYRFCCIVGRKRTRCELDIDVHGQLHSGPPSPSRPPRCLLLARQCRQSFGRSVDSHVSFHRCFFPSFAPPRFERPPRWEFSDRGFSYYTFRLNSRDWFQAYFG